MHKPHVQFQGLLETFFQTWKERKIIFSTCLLQKMGTLFQPCLGNLKYFDTSWDIVAWDTVVVPWHTNLDSVYPRPALYAMSKTFIMLDFARHILSKCKISTRQCRPASVHRPVSTKNFSRTRVHHVVSANQSPPASVHQPVSTYRCPATRDHKLVSTSQYPQRECLLVSTTECLLASARQLVP